ncbi:MAG: DUF58 domain-containing protein [Thermoplasmata archaeon]|nr:DUF58 domain-containing protein [Thermoplasmata archaeon]
MITQRGWGAVAAALGALVVAVVTLNYLILIVTIAVFAFLTADVVGFHYSVPRLDASQFSVERGVAPKRAAVGGDITMQVTVTYHGTRGFWGEFYEVIPARCTILHGQASETRWWTPGASVTLEYTARVLDRGEHHLGPPVMLAVGPMGLSYAQAILPGETSILGIPASALRRPGAPAHALQTRVHGGAVLKHRGYGTEVHSLRPYVGTDDVRHVAWRRSTPEELFIREYEQEARQEYLLVFDVSPSMAAGPAGATALDVAASAGWVLGGLVERSGDDRVGLASYADRLTAFLPPGRGRRHFTALEERLAMLAPAPEPFDLVRLLDDLSVRLRTHTHVFLFSAGTAEGDRLGPTYRRFLSRGHRLYLFTPDVVRLYPARSAAADLGATRWAQRLELERLRERLSSLRAGGIPAVRFDARNATRKLLGAYGRVRGWGRAG